MPFVIAVLPLDDRPCTYDFPARIGAIAGQRLIDCVGGHLTALERQEHARTVHRIEKPERIADQHPAVAGTAGGTIRVIGDDMHLANALGIFHARLKAGAVGNFLFQCFLGS